ncbi:MAG: hypothetical protein INR64_19655, partial [Caulobacteraceae bacterium]|nr:hypothetical protein [Caulobacter sp.]
FTYKTWRVNTDAVGGRLPDEVQASLRAQLDIVDSLRIKPEIAAFFHTVPMAMIPTSRGGAGDYSFESHRAQIAAKVDPPENPVVLHELLHAYHDQRLGRRDPRLLDLYAATRASGAFPAEAYMLKNPGEFFAMCGSVVLWGRAARAPFTREAVQAKAPAVYDWLVATFGLQLG